MSDAHTDRLGNALADRYRIEHELGAGGMATVYLAQDLKHNRHVALKVLKPELAAVVGAERFLAEIETTANLQHPHILPLYDSGEADSFLFYVMPYVEGETLLQRLDRDKQLPVDEAVRIATSVAGALDYAHRHGVVHRDVKPGNIMMQDGQPVVGDFGIALAVGAAGGARLTETGLSLGTPHYMSPEQATGEGVGPSADIWALGCVLYEMLVGEPPFTGSTPQAVLGKIIMGEVPSAKGERASVPPNVNAVIAKALEKVPADRFGAAQDLATALGDASFRHEGAGGVAAAQMGRAAGPWKWLTVAFAGLSLVLAVALVLGRAGGSSAVDLGISRIAIGLPAGESVHEDTRPAAISPDGRSIAYVGRSEDGIQLFHKALDQLDGVPIPGTDGATQPFFSPDGKWIGFFSSLEMALKKVPVAGGSVEQIAYVGNATLRGVDWAPNDTVYFMDSAGLAFEKVAASGGTPIVAAASGGRGPTLLPDRTTLLLEHNDTAIALDLESGRRTVLLVDASTPQYANSGHLLYVKSDNSLYAARFDLDKIQITGREVRVAEGVARPGNGAAAFWLSDEGTLLYVQEGGSSGRTIVSVSRDGVEQAIPGVDCDCWYPRYSPDGQRLLLDRGGEIWAYDLRDGSSVPITAPGTRARFPSWVPPDGDRISFLGPVGDRQFYRNVWSSSRGGGELEQLMEEVPGLTASQDEGSWSLDGRYFVFSWQTEGPRRGADLYVVDMDGGRLPERLTEGTHYAPVISPDGRWIAHSSRETGREEIFVRRFPEASNPIQVSRDGGRSPVWGPDMSELYYREGSALVAVSLETEPDFSMLDRRVLFDGPYLAELEGPSYDVHPSGDSFAMTKLEPWEARLVLVRNFFEELKRLVQN